MLPYILAAVGGYLIGDSMKKQYARGGMMADGADGGKTKKSLTYFEIYDDNTGKTLNIQAYSFDEAEKIASTIEFDNWMDGEDIEYADGMMAKGGLTESQEELISDAIASKELKEKAKKKIKQGDAILSVAYTDYGGNFGDKVLIEYFKKNYPKNIVFESAAYNGQNAILFGKPVEEFKKLDSAWDFEDSHSFYLDLQSEVEEKEFKEFVKHLKYKKYKVSPKTLDWLLQNRSGYYQLEPNGLDFHSEELEKELIEEGLIKK